MLAWWQSYLVSAVGALVLYCVLNTWGKNIVEFLPHLVPHWRSKWTPTVEALLFVGLGALVAQGVGPLTFPQALSAGFGWTGLMSFVPSGR